MPSKKVCIVGGGATGLCVAKELRDEGHAPFVFEAQPSIGGVYSRAPSCTTLTTSSHNTAFGSDPVTESKIWSCNEYVEYLKSYVQKHGLSDCLTFQSRILDAKHSDDGWDVAIEDGFGKVTSHRFDCLAVCNGLNTHAAPIPEVLTGSSARIHHSSMIRDISIFKGRRVLLVGCGESGSDFALAISKTASEAVLSMRNGPGYVIPRMYAGKVTDRDTTRAYHSLPKWLHAGLPWLVAFKSYLEELYLTPQDDREVLSLVGKINQQYTKSKGLSAFNRFGTKNASFVEATVRHGLRLAPGISHVAGNAFTFADGSIFEADDVVCCTGFKPRFPFLERHHPQLASMAPRSLFKRCLVPPSHAYSVVTTSLFFGGLVRPAIGSIPPMAEMQARYYALLLSGKRALPLATEADDTIREDADADHAQFPLDAMRVGALTDYMRYLSSMARLIGCEPCLASLLLWRPAIWFRVLVGPLTATQFRLYGPGAQRSKAEAAISKMPLMPPPVLIYELLLLLGCKLLALLGASVFQPIAF